jgi:hypothetical protein
MPSTSFYNVAPRLGVRMRSSGVPATISKNIRGTQLLAQRPFKVAAVATTDHVIGAVGSPNPVSQISGESLKMILSNQQTQRE